ncbi:MAG: DRTGG domain-containing protein [Bacteroidales bacterium]|nr:DRTGG domain-containing protein [Bacteroidales bacterium]MDD4684722.1 DRTGG domain-containing protein [Bacteroidales bacterium]
MTVRELKEKLNLRLVSGEEGLDNVIDGGYTSDLLSDVMGNAEMGQCWITLQTHKNIMAIASLKDLACIVLVKDLKPNQDTIEQSNEEGIPILTTSKEAFEITGEIYALLK